MLDLKFVVENLGKVEKGLRMRGISVDIGPISALAEKRRGLLKDIEGRNQRRNQLAKEIPQKAKAGQDIGPLKEESVGLRDELGSLEKELEEILGQLVSLLTELPNLPHDSVPIGEDETSNRVERTWGQAPIFDFEPKAHWDIGQDLGILDLERAAKISGARFCLYWGLGAKLERVLIDYMIDLHVKEHGYTEVLPPFLVTGKSMFGTGQLPKFEDDLFKTTTGERDLYLNPTAEVPVTNIHQNEILNGADLPLKYVAYTPCFRREAGSYGKDTRGIIRQHQFNKVELVKFAEPSTSYAELDGLLADAEVVLQNLGLHYRITTLCTGDLGFSAAKTYDIEVWLPGQGCYKEISSCTNFEDFQARRTKIRFKSGPKAKPQLVHTINGSGLAIGRTVVAILENYQQEDGTVVIPEVLRDRMGTDRITKA